MTKCQGLSGYAFSKHSANPSRLDVPQPLPRPIQRFESPFGQDFAGRAGGRGGRALAAVRLAAGAAVGDRGGGYVFQGECSGLGHSGFLPSVRSWVPDHVRDDEGGEVRRGTESRCAVARLSPQPVASTTLLMLPPAALRGSFSRKSAWPFRLAAFRSVLRFDNHNPLPTPGLPRQGAGHDPRLRLGRAQSLIGFVAVEAETALVGGDGLIGLDSHLGLLKE